jgi:hypothetical protein
VRRAVTRIWEAILDNIGTTIGAALVALFIALYALLRSGLPNWAVALRIWLLSLHIVALPGVVWLVASVALVLVVYWTVRGFVTQRRAAQPKTAEHEADDQSMPEWVRAVGAKLDDLILDLQPCFAVGSHRSIYEAFHSSSETKNDPLWNQTHYLLHVLGAWFHAWDDMRQAIGPYRPPEVLVEQIKSLNALLMNLGNLVAPDLSKRFENFPTDHYARVAFRPVADRYNHFLTEYEALLRRLPKGVLDPSPLGKERVFIRL